MALPTFPFTEVKRMDRWTNYSATIPERAIPIYCTPDVLGTIDADAPPKLQRHGDALKAILDHCMQGGHTLRALGSRWSFSRIIEPGDVVIDPGNLDVVLKVKPEWIESDYRAARPGTTPVFVQGGTRIARVNRRLGESGLALQTSGAGDGHRVAGCLATGTHGSALGIGAVHDTVLGVHLVLASDRSVFVQPATGAAMTDDVAGWLQKQTGIPTEPKRDDNLFRAALVSLGSLGFVHGVVFETVDLYRLRGEVIATPFDDAKLWNAIRKLDTSALQSNASLGRPYHFEVVFHPYPLARESAAFARMYWKTGVDGQPFDSPAPGRPDTSSDMMGFIAGITELVDISISTPILRTVISGQLNSRFVPGMKEPVFPGMAFGPTTLPPGHGASTEIFVPHARVDEAITLIYQVLHSEAAQGRHLLGPVALRFIPATKALLGMNVHDMTCCIEMPSVRNSEVLGIYMKCWDALERHGVPFTCHWGQLHGMNEARLQRYFGPRAASWKAARNELLPTAVARKVFGAPILAEVGLDG